MLAPVKQVPRAKKMYRKGMATELGYSKLGVRPTPTYAHSPIGGLEFIGPARVGMRKRSSEYKSSQSRDAGITTQRCLWAQLTRARSEINDILDKADDVPDNLSPPVKLDVAHVDDWQSLREHIRGSSSTSDQGLPHYDGVIMRESYSAGEPILTRR